MLGKMKLAQVLTSLCLLTPLLAQPVSQPPSLPHLFSRAPGYGSCPAASWPPLDVGVPLVPQMPDGELSSMLAQVSPANIEATIRKLVSFGTRHTLSTQNSTTRGIGAARDWIFSEMQKIANSTDGRMTAEVISYTQGLAERITFPVVISDVVGTLKGTDDPDRFYVISGHYDSRVTDVLNFSDDAPGADDDASGVAGEHSHSRTRLMLLGKLTCTRDSGFGISTRYVSAPAQSQHNLHGSGRRGARSLRF